MLQALTGGARRLQGAYIGSVEGAHGTPDKVSFKSFVREAYLGDLVTGGTGSQGPADKASFKSLPLRANLGDLVTVRAPGNTATGPWNMASFAAMLLGKFRRPTGRTWTLEAIDFGPFAN